MATLNGSTSFDSSELRNVNLELLNYGGRIEISTWFGLKLEYTAFNWALDVFIPTCYKNSTNGINI